MNATQVMKKAHNVTYVIDNEQYKGMISDKPNKIQLFCESGKTPKIKAGAKVIEIINGNENILYIDRHMQTTNMDDLPSSGGLPNVTMVFFSFYTEAEHKKLLSQQQPSQVHNYNNSAPVSTGDNVQVSGSFNGNLTIETLLEHVNSSNDKEAKTLLSKLFNNQTISKLVNRNKVT